MSFKSPERPLARTATSPLNLQFIIPPTRLACIVGFGYLQTYYCTLPGKIEHYVDGRTQRESAEDIRPVVALSTCTCQAPVPDKVTSRCRVRVFYSAVTTPVVLSDFQGRWQAVLFKKGHGGHSHCHAIHHLLVGAPLSPGPLMVADHW